MKKILVVICLLIFAQAAKAQEAAIGPILGYYKTQDADKGALILGAAARFKLANLIGVEGSIGYRKEEYEDGKIKVTSYPVTATGILYVMPMIYAAGGAGWYNYKADYDNSLGLKNETSQNFGYHIGGGVELSLGNLMLTGDIKYVFLNLELDNIPTDVESNFYVLTAGVLFRL
ncbi:MAG: outer membrane beta-barrel protein [Ignavibacteriales bacterium]|nr:outer membrane beta-barrel protein [Ignavibacteriales bacterium]